MGQGERPAEGGCNRSQAQNLSGGSSANPSGKQGEMGKVERGAEIANFGKPRIGSQDSDSRRSSLACRSLASSILVAPQAKIMRLKSFNAKGTGYDSDILRFPQTCTNR